MVQFWNGMQVDKELPPLEQLQNQVRQALLNLGPEALPAFVRGFNITVNYRLGFT